MSFDTSFLDPAADAHLASLLETPGDVLARIEREAQDEGQPAVGRAVGAFLRTLVAMTGGGRVLEVGTNIGHSGLWMAHGLAPEGRLDTIELDPELARRARVHFKEAGFHERIRVLEGAALDVLPTLQDGAYDLVFLDAVKSEYPAYLEHAARLLRPGGVVAADNVFWQGQVWDDAVHDEQTEGVRAFTRRIFQGPRWTSSIVPLEDGVSVSVLNIGSG